MILCSIPHTFMINLFGLLLSNYYKHTIIDVTSLHLYKITSDVILKNNHNFAMRENKLIYFCSKEEEKREAFKFF